MREAGRPIGRRATWLALVLAVLCSFGLTVATAGHLKIEAAARGWLGGFRPPRGELLRTVLDLLRPGDLALAGLLLLSAVALVALEVRGRHLTGILSDALRSPRAGLALLCFVAALAVRPYLDAGIPHAFDAKLHFAKALAAADQIRDGLWPGWTFSWYSGYPFLRFYGPLHYLLAGGLEDLLPGTGTGIKTLLVLCHLASAAGVYLLAREITRSRRAAVLATVAALLAYQRYHGLLTLGRHPEALVHALFPFALLTVERFARRPRAATGLLTGLLLGAAVLAHTALGTLAGGIAALYLVVRFLATRELRRRPLVTGAYGAAVAFATFSVIAFWIVPAFAEKPWVNLGSMGAGSPAKLLPGGSLSADLLHLPVWGPPARPGSTIAYAGLSVLVLAGVGLVRLGRISLARALPLAAAIAVVLLYAGGSYFQARAVLFLVPLLAVAAGAAVALPGAEHARPGRLAIAALAVVILDLLPLTALSPFRPDLEPVRRELRAAAPRFAGSKVVVASLRTGTPEVSQWEAWGGCGLATLAGPFREGGTPLFSWDMAVLDRVGRDLADGGALEPETLRALRLFGVGAILLEDGTGLARPPADPAPGYRISTSPPAIVLDDFAPAVFCREAAPGPEEAAAWAREHALLSLPGPGDAGWSDALTGLARLSGIRTDAPIAERAVLAPGESLPPVRGGAAPSSPPRFRVIASGQREVSFEVVAPGDGYLWLPFARYPGVRVRIDGRPARHARTLAGTLAVAVPGGPHRVAVRGPDGPVTGTGRLLSGIGLGVVAAVGVLLLLRAVKTRRDR